MGHGKYASDDCILPDPDIFAFDTVIAWRAVLVEVARKDDEDGGFAVMIVWESCFSSRFFAAPADFISFGLPRIDVSFSTSDLFSSGFPQHESRDFGILCKNVPTPELSCKSACQKSFSCGAP